MGLGMSRRRFLGATASAIGAGLATHVPRARAGSSGRGGGLFPGRGITVWHPEAASGHSVNPEAAQSMIDRGLTALTGEDVPSLALETLLPGLTATSKIAIKVNLIAGPSHVWTRWEVVQAMVVRLLETLGGSFPPENITIFDRHDLPAHGYTADRFPGVNLESTSDCTSGISLLLPGGTAELSRHISEADYLLNFPVLKNHYANHFTLGMKNHYGSISPPSWCGTFDAVLGINSFSEIKQKTALVVLDAVFGNFVGDVDGGPDGWSLFPGNTPQRLFMGTDPCVVEHLGQTIINEQREAVGRPPLPDHYLYLAGDPPYELGVTDPSAMDLLFVDASVVGAENVETVATSLSLSPARPNPFSRYTMWTLDVKQECATSAAIHDLSGRRVATILSGHVGPGTQVLRWDGLTDTGKPVGTGTYTLVVEAATGRLSSPVMVLR
jgi:hypothetical protein